MPLKHDAWLAGCAYAAAPEKAPAGRTEQDVWQQAAASRRRTTLDKPGAPPELNAYMKSKVPKGEVHAHSSPVHQG